VATITFHSMAESAYLWTAMHVADEKSVDYEVVPYGKERSHIENLSGQRKLPVLELQDGEIYREESAEMAARIRAGAFGAL